MRNGAALPWTQCQCIRVANRQHSFRFDPHQKKSACELIVTFSDAVRCVFSSFKPAPSRNLAHSVSFAEIARGLRIGGLFHTGRQRTPLPGARSLAIPKQEKPFK
jgi:hypothetical protein